MTLWTPYQTLILLCIDWSAVGISSSCRLFHVLIKIAITFFGSTFNNVSYQFNYVIMCLVISFLMDLFRGLMCCDAVEWVVLFGLFLNLMVVLMSLLVATNYGLFCPLKMTRLFESFILVCYLSEYYFFYYCSKNF